MVGDYMNLQRTQRRFAVMGKNTFLIASRIMENDIICRLLKYPVRDALDIEKYPNVDGGELINKQILIVPKIYDDENDEMSYVTAIFNDFTVNQINPEFKVTTVRFDIACPYISWALDGESLRPYLIMEEIDKMFNEQPLAGIGNLQFWRADALTLSPWIGGYSMKYKINEFN